MNRFQPAHTSPLFFSFAPRSLIIYSLISSLMHFSFIKSQNRFNISECGLNFLTPVFKAWCLTHNELDSYIMLRLFLSLPFSLSGFFCGSSISLSPPRVYYQFCLSPSLNCQPLWLTLSLHPLFAFPFCSLTD